MKILSKRLKEKPILATLLIAVIIGLICLVVYIINYFEPQIQVPPVIKVSYKDKEVFELQPVAYDWTYKNSHDTQEFNFDPNNYDYSNCTVYKSYNGGNPQMVAFPKYKFKVMNKKTYMYNADIGRYEEYDTDYQDFSQYVKYISLTHSTGTAHTYVSVYTMTYGEQGTATYVVKVVEQNDYRLGIIREYKGLNLENVESIKELVSKLASGVFLRDVQVEDGKLVLTYRYRITNNSANSISIALFCLIDELQEIEFRSENAEFVTSKYENNSTIYEPIENLGSIVTTRESIKQEINLDWTNLSKNIGL